MNKTQLFTRTAATTRGVATAPTDGSNEYLQWSEWADEELYNYGEVMDWGELFTTTNVVAAQSGTSVALPDNFKKLGGYPNFNGVLYPEVDRDIYGRSGGMAVGYNSGWFMNWTGALTSQTSVAIPHYYYPTGLASPMSQVPMRNPNYLVKRLQVRILKYRQDPIFTEIEAEADLLLKQMIENEYYKHSQYASSMSDHLQETGFELGAD